MGNQSMGDGTFLVRPSDTFVGDYSLSFFRKNDVHHVPIRIRQLENGVKKFYLIDKVFFQNLYDLITHYQSHPLKSSKFQIVLKDGAPQLNRLFVIGVAQFESLVDLISHYEKNALYKKVKLRTPVTEEILSRRGNMMMTENGGAEADYSAEGYMDPGTFTSSKCARALYEYVAKRSDELSFPRGALITNVSIQKPDGGWWRGDYAGKKSHWFPANYTQLEERSEPGHDNSDNHSDTSDNLQRGTFDIMDAEVEVSENGQGFRLKTTSSPYWTDLKCNSLEEATDWVNKIKEVVATASMKDTESKKKERNMKIAKELSSLVVYCKATMFSQDKMSQGHFTEMSSFSEIKADKLMCGSNGDPEWFLKYHRTQISRIYPKAQRILSDNYNPMPMWNCGSQMVSLNYQTGDKPMQINQAKFMDNGGCGYLLRPEIMFQDGYSPSDSAAPADHGSVTPLELSVRVIAARHLYRYGKEGVSHRRGLVSPSVEVELIGAEYDNVKQRTRTIRDNGLNPVWDEEFHLVILNPALALLRLSVYDEDMFGDPSFIGHSTLPVSLVQGGYRSVQLKNGHSEQLELSSLLLKISTSKGDTAAASSSSVAELLRVSSSAS